MGDKTRNEERSQAAQVQDLADAIRYHGDRVLEAAVILADAMRNSTEHRVHWNNQTSNASGESQGENDRPLQKGGDELPPFDAGGPLPGFGAPVR